MRLRALHLALAGVLVAAPGRLASEVRIECPVTVHHFGVIREADGPAHTSFAMINRGDEPLVVLGARANCGCTTPQWHPEAAAPGDTMWIDVAYDPSGRPGRFEKRIVVETNSSDGQRTSLRIAGTVMGSDATVASRYPYRVGNARVQNRYVVFSDVMHDESRGKYLEVYNAGADTIRPQIVGSSPMLNVVAQPAVVAPGEQFIYSVVVEVDKNGLWGPQNPTFTIRPDDASAETLEVEVPLYIRESFRGLSDSQLASAPMAIVDNTRLDLGFVPSSATAPLAVEATVTNRGDDPLKIRRVYCPDPGVKVVSAPSVIKRGKRGKLKFEVSADVFARSAAIDLPVTLITNDPDTPEIFLRITGVLDTPPAP